MQHNNHMSVSMKQTNQTMIFRCYLWLEWWQLHYQRWFDVYIRCMKRELEKMYENDQYKNDFTRVIIKLQ